jgi:hypothetical protein
VKIRRKLKPAAAEPDRGSVSIEGVVAIPLMIMIAIVVIEGLLAVGSLNAATQAARDGARTAAAGGDGVAAASAQLPGSVRVNAIDIGTNAVPGCSGVCSRVDIGIPLGLPGFLDLTFVRVTRSADFPVG